MKTFAWVIIIFVLAVGAYLVLFDRSLSAPLSTYSNKQYGITFKYPSSYVKNEGEVGSAKRMHYVITLMDKVAAANIPQGGEGPPVISIDIYQNNLDNLALEDWIRGTNDSNFKLSTDGKLSAVSAAGTQAYFYRWDGLYRGDSYALAHKGNIVVFSVTYLTEQDQIRNDFEKVLGSLELN